MRRIAIKQIPSICRDAAYGRNEQSYAVSTPAAFCSFSRSMASSRILYLRIYPAAFIGNADTNSM